MEEIKNELDEIRNQLSGFKFWLMIIALALCVYVGYSIKTTEDVKSEIRKAQHNRY